jgi:hypothetical protein
MVIESQGLMDSRNADAGDQGCCAGRCDDGHGDRAEAATPRRSLVSDVVHGVLLSCQFQRRTHP